MWALIKGLHGWTVTDHLVASVIDSLRWTVWSKEMGPLQTVKRPDDVRREAEHLAAVEAQAARIRAQHNNDRG